MSRSWDAVVVGAGGSGLAAACSVVDQGGSVLVLEKQPLPGGTTAIAVGSFTAAETRWQRAADIEDNAADHAEDAGRFARPEIEARNNGPLREFFLTQSAATLDWIEQMGLAFVGPHPEPPNRVPRMHNVVPGAKAYIAAMQHHVQRGGGQLLCDAAVERLIVEDGKVVGVEAAVGGVVQKFSARRGVVLAAGDYASNDALLAEHKGSEYRQIDGINPFAHGDGHVLAESVGAELVNMDITYGPALRFVSATPKPFQLPWWLPSRGWLARGLASLTPWVPKAWLRQMIKRLLVTWQHPENSLFDDGAILLNRAGRRFVDETRWPDREIAVARQTDKVAFILLDGQLIDKYSAWPHFISTAPDIAYAYVADYERLRPDVTCRRESLEELARARDLDPAAVADTARLWNEHAGGGEPDAFGRTDNHPPLDRGPWVLLGPVRAYFTTTEGGARINQQMRVLKLSGEVIEGLYAVGQNGLGGMVLFGHGLHIAWALTSGRLAGQALMQD